MKKSAWFLVVIALTVIAPLMHKGLTMTINYIVTNISK
jgi:hypothetical protein